MASSFIQAKRVVGRGGRGMSRPYDRMGALFAANAAITAAKAL